MIETSSTSDSLRSCFYDVLGVPPFATQDEIRQAYLSLAFQCHPDRNQNSSESNHQFQRLQEAYAVLSNPHQRYWYDSHREAFLRRVIICLKKGECSPQGKNFGEEEIDISQYCDRSAIRDFCEHGEESFFKVYGELFQRIAREESSALAWRDHVDEEKTWELLNPPVFGTSKTTYRPEVAAFYSFWKGFVTRRQFLNKNVYNLAEAPDRKTRRLMEKENKRLRDSARRRRTEEIRRLVDFVYRIDPRVEEYIQFREKSHQERESVLTDDQGLPTYSQNEVPNLESDEGDEMEAYAPANEAKTGCKLYCAVCNRYFRSKNQVENHERSKKHKLNLKNLQKEISLPGYD